jgi:hypothetical protein
VLVGWVDDAGDTTIIGGDSPNELTVSYTIENREPSALRDVTAGIWTRSGNLYPFHGFFVQILPSGQDQSVSGFEIPSEALAEDPAEGDLVSRFIYWARFVDESGRRWEARYDPLVKRPKYSLLNRGSFFPWRRSAP